MLNTNAATDLYLLIAVIDNTIPLILRAKAQIVKITQPGLSMELITDKGKNATINATIPINNEGTCNFFLFSAIFILILLLGRFHLAILIYVILNRDSFVDVSIPPKTSFCIKMTPLWQPERMDHIK